MSEEKSVPEPEQLVRGEGELIFPKFIKYVPKGQKFQLRIGDCYAFSNFATASSASVTVIAFIHL